MVNDFDLPMEEDEELELSDPEENLKEYLAINAALNDPNSGLIELDELQVMLREEVRLLGTSEVQEYLKEKEKAQKNMAKIMYNDEEQILQPPEGEELDLSTLPETVKRYYKLKSALLDKSPGFYNSDKYYQILEEVTQLSNAPEVQEHLFEFVDEPQTR